MSNQHRNEWRVTAHGLRRVCEHVEPKVVVICGGGGGGNTNTVQKSDPWPGQTPYLQDLFSQAQNWYNSSNPQYYPGQTLAPVNANQTLGLDLQRQAALGPMASIAGMGANSINTTLDPSMMLNPDNNPYLQDYATAAAQPIQDTLTQKILPSIRTNSVMEGNYGSSRQGIAEGLASKAALNAIGNQTADIYSNAYGQGLTALGRSQALAPQMAQMALMPGATLGNVGDVQRSFDQQQIADAIQKWNYNQNLPLQKLQSYQGLVGGADWGGTTQTSQPYFTNPWGATIGGGMMGGTLGGAITGSTMSAGGSATAGAASGASTGSTFSWPGALLGALLGYAGTTM